VFPIVALTGLVIYRSAPEVLLRQNSFFLYSFLPCISLSVQLLTLLVAPKTPRSGTSKSKFMRERLTFLFRSKDECQYLHVSLSLDRSSTASGSSERIDLPNVTITCL
jgi:hypothetical protein